MFLEWFSLECRKTKTKVITLANHKGHRQSNEPIVAVANRGETRAYASRLVLVVFLVGWKSGAKLLSQSCGVESVKPITFRHSNEYRSNDSWSQNVIGVPWSWRFVQRSLALFSFCKKLIQTKRIFFLLKLNRSVTPLSAICARELLVRLKPRDRRKVPITQQEKVYVTKRISSSRNPSLYKRYMAIQWTATMKKPVEIQLRVVWLLVNNDKSLLSRLIKFTCLFARVFPSHHRTRLGRHSCWAGR